MSTTNAFAPKDAETIKTEILEELEIDYDDNQELIDKLVARGLKDEQFKASLHADKTKHLTEKQKLAKALDEAGIDAETGQKKAETNVTAKKENDFSLADIRALNDVHDDDIQDVVDYAKYKNISIAEAKASAVVKATLKEKEEARTIAEATNTGGSKYKNSTPSPDAIIEKARSGGEIKTKEDFDALAEARIEAKRNQNKN